jgi:hypothetical protein
MKTMRTLICCLALSIATAASAQSNIEPPSGLVPDEKTAIAIAVAVFIPIFGAEKIKQQQPFHAQLESGVWHVTGSIPPHFRGGTAEAEIERKDGRVIRVWHGR